jgi:DNA-binding GntR family transcriptional regulator
MNRNIYQEIKNRILFMDYLPGQILNEKILAQEFGMSRTPLREVLNRLEWDQLVRVLPRTGTMVTEIEFQKMMYTFQVRFEVEELVGKLAAEHMTDVHTGRMKTLQEKCNTLLETKSRRELAEIDIAFREILFEAAGNPVLRDISIHLYNLSFRLWFIILDRGPWSEEVQSVSDEISSIITSWENDAASIGSLRRELLLRHVERIRVKFLGMSSNLQN